MTARSLPSETTTSLLTAAAQTHPAVALLVQDEANRLAALEKQKVIDFDYLSELVWKMLNVTYARVSGSVAYDVSGDAVEKIEKCFDIIRENCPKGANFRTKESALETLRKIGKSICLCNGVIGREIRNYCVCGWELMSTMRAIVDELSG